MKKSIAKYLLLLVTSTIISIPFLSESAFAQDTAARVKWTKITIRLYDRSKMSGYLYKVEDDSVLLIRDKIPYKSSSELLSQPRIAARPERIDKIYVNNKRMAPLIGAGIGFGAGVITGFLIGNDPPGFISFSASDKAVMLGATGGVIGAITGLIIHLAASKTLIISGKKDNYRSYQKQLALQSLIH